MCSPENSDFRVHGISLNMSSRHVELCFSLVIVKFLPKLKNHQTWEKFSKKLRKALLDLT